MKPLRQPSTTPYAAARWLVCQRGVSVIPIDHPASTRESDPQRIGKVPRLGTWKLFQTALPTDDNLRRWFPKGEPRNVAIVTGAVSRLVAIDGDTPAALQWMRTHLPPTPMGTRTTKGEHWFYQHPGTPVRNAVRLHTGDASIAIDIRADGGYCVAPPSVHASGAVYERLGEWPPVDQLPRFERTWIAPAEPTHAVRRARPMANRADESNHVLRRAQAYVDRVPPAIQGQGGDLHTFQLACKLVRGFGLSETAAFEVLQIWNRSCVPPWSDHELEEKIRSARNYGTEPIGGRVSDGVRHMDASGRTTASAPSDAPRTFAQTDSGNSDAFASWYGNDWRFDFQRGVWRHWDPPIWAPDGDGLVYRDAIAAMRRRYHEAGAIPDLADRTHESKWPISSESRARVDACLFLAARTHPLADAGAWWDPDPFQLACQQTVVDLHTGDWRQGRQSDRLTMQTVVPYDPAAACPRFERFLLEIAGGDDELVDYLHRALGYSITGEIGEQCLWLLYGPGSGGKTTLLRIIASVLGSYAYTAPFSTFLKDQHASSVTNDLATLRGKRFVSASEVRERAKLDEGRIKSLTGGDPMTARFLHQEFFTFRPTLHLWLAVNHKPVVTDDSFAFWRRVRLVPLTQRFAINRSLEAELLAEAPGILAWLVRGCLLWQIAGLTAPESVASATTEYEQDSDPLADFLAAECEIDADTSIRASDFYKLYLDWAERAGVTGRDRLSLTAFGRFMGERFEKDRTSANKLYRGIGRRIMSGLDQ